MSDIKQRAAACKHVTHSPNNTRVYELSRLARHLFPDGQGDYTLPETSIGKHLAVALITHLARAGQRDSRWLFKFCADRVPWLDPDNIDVTTLLPDKAQTLGNKLELTAALRTRLHVTSIASCDQTPEQRIAAQKEQRRLRERERRQRKRIEANRMTRMAWLAAHTTSRDRPWIREGVSRRTYYRRLRQGSRAPAHPRTHRANVRGTGTVTGCSIVGGHATCANPKDTLQ